MVSGWILWNDKLTATCEIDSEINTIIPKTPKTHDSAESLKNSALREFFYTRSGKDYKFYLLNKIDYRDYLPSKNYRNRARNVFKLIGPKIIRSFQKPLMPVSS